MPIQSNRTHQSHNQIDPKTMLAELSLLMLRHRDLASDFGTLQTQCYFTSHEDTVQATAIALEQSDEALRKLSDELGDAALGKPPAKPQADEEPTHFTDTIRELAMMLADLDNIQTDTEALLRRSDMTDDKREEIAETLGSTYIAIVNAIGRTAEIAAAQEPPVTVKQTLSQIGERIAVLQARAGDELPEPQRSDVKAAIQKARDAIDAAL